MDFSLLQVGINGYSGIPLRGCLNDCENLLRQMGRYGLKPREHRVLCDREATRAGILAGLRWLLDQDAPTLIFQYSGHGSRVRDLDGDEKSHYDSAICPVDYDSAGVILDDTLAALYALCPIDKRLIVFSDSCHSGGSQRSLTHRQGLTRMKQAVRLSIPRFLPAQMVEPGDQQGLARMRRKTFIENAEHCVLISTCRPDQTSADAWIDKKWQGAGTAALLSAWRECGLRGVYGAMATVANRWLYNNGYPQVLRVEGRAENLHRPFFT